MIDAKTRAVLSAAWELDNWLHNVTGAKLFRRLMRMGMPCQKLHDALQQLDGGIAPQTVVFVVDAKDLDEEVLNRICNQVGDIRLLETDANGPVCDGQD